jgi:endonuclease/exonuclease/phosphatase family metal-dependent hydrolase
MKKLNTILIFLVILFFSQSAICQGLLKLDYPLRVASYNIRFDNPNDRDNVWANRKDRVANLLRFHKADIFCLQEALINQVEDLEAEFPNYEYCGVGRDDGKKAGEFCPVFYDAARFIVIRSGTFWLSETPHKAGSTGWFATLPRIVTWVKFRNKLSGNAFYIFNTHLDHSSQSARDNGSKLIMDKIDEMSEGLPVILTGDFNDKPDSNPYNNITKNTSGVSMMDAKLQSKYPAHGPTFTFVGWDFIGVPGKIIDYIFVNEKVEVIQHAVIGDNIDGVYPSDHLPILVEIELE